MNKDQIKQYLNLPPERRDFSLFLREILLTDIFGPDKNEILYYYGKDLANNFTFDSLDEICNLFEQFGFGALALTKVKKDTYLFRAQGTKITERLEFMPEADFSLETGFIAQAIKLATKRIAEGQWNVNRKMKFVEFLIQTLNN